jgi:hypothetical protein
MMVVTILFGLFALPALIFGFYLVACSVRIHTTEVSYVEYPYLAVGSGLVMLGAGIFSCAWSWFKTLTTCRASIHSSVFGMTPITDSQRTRPSSWMP